MIFITVINHYHEKINPKHKDIVDLDAFELLSGEKYLINELNNNLKLLYWPFSFYPTRIESYDKVNLAIVELLNSSSSSVGATSKNDILIEFDGRNGALGLLTNAKSMHKKYIAIERDRSSYETVKRNFAENQVPSDSYEVCYDLRRIKRVLGKIAQDWGDDVKISFVYHADNRNLMHYLKKSSLCFSFSSFLKFF